MKPIYLDYNATTPVDPAVAEAMRPYLEERFGNPSSAHFYGRETKGAVALARSQVAELLECLPEEVIFTSGGTESNNMALKGVAFASPDKGNHIITSEVEHPAILEVCQFLERSGFQVTYVGVDKLGIIRMEDLEAAITERTVLLSVMHANNEVGSIQPIPEIARLAHKHGIPFHSDAAQSIGKIAAVVDDLGVDLLSIAGHKIYASKGIGALYVRDGTRLEKFMHGAAHERDFRAGTENVLQIVGLGQACKIAKENLREHARHMRAMRERLYEGLKQHIPEIQLNGHPTKRLPNTLSIGFKGLRANELLADLDQVAASAGAACHADSIDISATLKAMKVPVEYAMGTVRFSTGRFLTAGDIDEAVRYLLRRVKEMKEP